MGRHDDIRPRFTPGWRASLLLIVALAGWHCTTVQQGGSQRTALTAATGAKISAADLRAMANVLAISVPGTIEGSADEMAARSPDAATRRRALLWKIELVPAFYQALFVSDSLAAALDAWSLSIQVEDAVSTGAWRDRLGSMQPAAVDASRRMRLLIEGTVKATARTEEGYEKARGAMERWAARNPIVGPLSSRPSIIPELVRLAADGLDVSVFQVMADIPATIADLATRIDIYAAYLPRAVRWNAELMADDFADRPGAQRALDVLASVSALTERTNALLSKEGMRLALDDASGRIRAERIAVLASIDEQRRETLTHLTGERVAATAEIERQRDALVRQIDELRGRATSDAEAVARRVIRQAAIAIALLLVLAAALTLVVVRVAWKLRAPRPGAG